MVIRRYVWDFSHGPSLSTEYDDDECICKSAWSPPTYLPGHLPRAGSVGETRFAPQQLCAGLLSLTTVKLHRRPSGGNIETIWRSLWLASQHPPHQNQIDEQVPLRRPDPRTIKKLALENCSALSGAAAWYLVFNPVRCDSEYLPLSPPWSLEPGRQHY